MVGDDIKEQPHPILFEFPGQSLEIRRAAQLRIELRRVNHVVAVPAAPARPENRRGIEVGYPEPVEIRHQPARVFKTKLPVELKTIGSQGYTPVEHLANPYGELLPQRGEQPEPLPGALVCLLCSFLELGVTGLEQPVVEVLNLPQVYGEGQPG